MVIFEKIRYKNFLSAGNTFIEIILNEFPTTIITGKNGAGKSTILDALTFVLFGRPFREVNKPNVVNSINQRDCVVEIEFRIGQKAYKIIRGIKPTIFEIYCDGVLVNQDSKSRDYQEYLEKFILKMNFKSFTQIVVLGSATFVPFMQLTASDRRAIIEDLLDIKVFSSMNVILKQKLLFIRDGLNKIKHDQDLNSIKIEAAKKLIKEMQNNVFAKIGKYKKDIEDASKSIEKLTEDSGLVQLHIIKLQNQIDDEQKVRGKSKKLLDIENKLLSNKKKYSKELDFYVTNDNCPTCTQDIDVAIKASRIEQSQKKINELNTGISEIEKEIWKANGRIEEINKITKKISEHSSELIRYNTKITETNKYIRKIQDEISQINESNTESNEELNKLEELELEAKKLGDEQTTLVTDRHYYDIAASLLKDTGIKTKIIAQYLPIINKLINKYLSEMDFFVNFTLNENFEETIKSRFRDDFSYENFSEGEKQRINISLMLAWREVAKLKNSINTNLMVFDEILDSSLDFGGIDIIINILNGFGDKVNIFIISPKADVFGDKFKSSIKFEKRNGFSVIIE